MVMLKYIGNGAFSPGVPARDLTDDEVKEYGGVVVLVKTGLYERVKTKEVKPIKKASGTRKNDNPADTRQNKKQNGESD